MSPTVIAVFVLLVTVTAAEARKKPLTYEFTGTVRSSRVPHHDMEGSFADEHGDTTYVHCDTNPSTSSHDCGVDQPSAYYVTLDNNDPGKHEVVVFNWDPNVALPKECNEVVGLAHVFDCDPLRKIAEPGAKATFRYRRVWVEPGYGYKDYGRKHRATDFGWEDFCVPFAVADRQGQKWQSEACYRRE